MSLCAGRSTHWIYNISLGSGPWRGNILIRKWQGILTEQFSTYFFHMAIGLQQIRHTCHVYKLYELPFVADREALYLWEEGNSSACKR